MALERKDEEIGIFLLTILARYVFTQNEHIPSYPHILFPIIFLARAIISCNFFLYSNSYPFYNV